MVVTKKCTREQDSSESSSGASTKKGHQLDLLTEKLWAAKQSYEIKLILYIVM